MSSDEFIEEIVAQPKVDSSKPNNQPNSDDAYETPDVPQASEQSVTSTKEPKVTEVKPEETKPEESKTTEVKSEETKPEEPKATEVQPEEPKATEVQPEETKPEESKGSEETKPEESKATEVQPEETKPEELKATEVQPEEPKTTEVKPEETKPEESKAIEVKPEETKPEEPKTTEIKSEETEPEESKATEVKPEETKPEESKATEVKPEEPKATEVKPEETKPEEPKATEVKPEETETEEPKATEVKPEETKPEEPKATEVKPEETKPEEPKVTEVKPEETKPEEPKTTEVKPEETEPEEPKATEGQPEEPKATEVKPEETKPEEPKVTEVKPEETKPEESKAIEVKPEETKPEEPKATGVQPEETKPEEPKATEVQPEESLTANDHHEESSAYSYMISQEREKEGTEDKKYGTCVLEPKTFESRSALIDEIENKTNSFGKIWYKASWGDWVEFDDEIQPQDFTETSVEFRVERKMLLIDFLENPDFAAISRDPQLKLKALLDGASEYRAAYETVISRTFKETVPTKEEVAEIAKISEQDLIAFSTKLREKQLSETADFIKKLGDAAHHNLISIDLVKKTRIFLQENRALWFEEDKAKDPQVSALRRFLLQQPLLQIELILYDKQFMEKVRATAKDPTLLPPLLEDKENLENYLMLAEHNLARSVTSVALTILRKPAVVEAVRQILKEPTAWNSVLTDPEVKKDYNILVKQNLLPDPEAHVILLDEEFKAKLKNITPEEIDKFLEEDPPSELAIKIRTLIDKKTLTYFPKSARELAKREDAQQMMKEIRANPLVIGTYLKDPTKKALLTELMKLELVKSPLPPVMLENYGLLEELDTDPLKFWE